jgi:hypothetical protein
MSTEAPPAPAAAPAQLAPTTPDAPAAPVTPSATPAPAPAPAAPVETPPAAPAAWDGKLQENWFLGLGDEFAPHAKDLEKHKDIRSIITELNYFRKNGVEYPADGSPASAIERFRKVAGVPEDPTGYGLTAEAMKLPEGMSFDSELAAAVAEAAHRTHTPPAAVQAMAGVFNDILAKRSADAAHAEAKAKAEAKDALVKEWRSDFQHNASTVRHITEMIGQQAGIAADDPAIAEFISDVSAKPGLAKLMLQVSKMVAEDRIVTPNGFGNIKSPAQQLADIDAGNDPTWSPLLKSSSAEDRARVYEHKKALREKAKAT